MGADANLIAVGPFSKGIQHRLYGGNYDRCVEGQPVSTVVIMCDTDTMSEDLAYCFGTTCLESHKHTITAEQALRADQRLRSFGEDYGMLKYVEDVRELAQHGFTFYLLPRF